MDNLFDAAINQVMGDIKYLNEEGTDFYGHIANAIFIAHGKGAVNEVEVREAKEEVQILGYAHDKKTGVPATYFLPKIYRCAKMNLKKLKENKNVKN